MWTFLAIKKRCPASAGNRTRINCLEGSYADHYTTDAIPATRGLWSQARLGWRQSPFFGHQKRGVLRRPGIEPGSTAWKAAMLTIIPPTLFLPVQGWVPGLGLARTRLGQPKGPSSAACVNLRIDSCFYQIASCCGMLPSCHFSPKEVTDWGCLEVPPRFELGSQDSKS